jgi:hypothetical protein
MQEIKFSVAIFPMKYSHISKLYKYGCFGVGVFLFYYNLCGRYYEIANVNMKSESITGHVKEHFDQFWVFYHNTELFTMLSNIRLFSN